MQIKEGDTSASLLLCNPARTGASAVTHRGGLLGSLMQSDSVQAFHNTLASGEIIISFMVLAISLLEFKSELRHLVLTGATVKGRV